MLHPPNCAAQQSHPAVPTTPSLARRSWTSQFRPFGGGCFKSAQKLASFLPETRSELHFEGSQSLPEPSLLSGCLPSFRDSQYTASRAICQCLCLDKQSVSISVCGFSWDQLCLPSPLNGRAVCKHPATKPSGAHSGPTAELPVPCVTHPLPPRQGTTARSAFPHSCATAGSGSCPSGLSGPTRTAHLGALCSCLAHGAGAAESSPE